MERLANVQGFSQRHFDDIALTKFLPAESIPFDLPFHRSKVNVQLIRRDVKGFENLKTEMPTSDMLKYAIAKTRRDFHLPEPAKMYHLNDIFKIQDLSIWSSSPGLPWKEAGYRTKRAIKDDPEAVRRVRKFWHLIKGGKKLIPPDSMAFVRSHLAPLGEEKVRAVWGYPATMTFGEGVFALPLINAYKNHYGHIGYGYETAIGGFKKIFQRFAGKPHYVTMDFKSFDKTVPAWLIEVAFDILLDNLNLQDYEDWGVADVKKMLRMWDYIKNYFIHTTIRLCNGERYRKHSGVASGSYFTQLLDSVVNAVLINWIHLEITGQFPRDYLVMGDDSLVACDRPLDFDAVQDLLDPIGMIINFRKSAQSKSLNRLQFIGYSMTIGIPSKPEDELFAALAFPERPDREFSDLQNRALGLLYAGMGEHERFHQMCTAIIKLQPFDIAIPPHLRRLIELVLGVTVKHSDPPSQMAFLRRLL